ncbi:hypothetical protein OKHIF_27200 [Mycobacteroides chelonae]
MSPGQCAITSTAVHPESSEVTVEEADSGDCGRLSPSEKQRFADQKAGRSTEVALRDKGAQCET